MKEEIIKEKQLKLIKQLENIKSIQELNNLKVEYLGKKGIITEISSNLKDLSIEERKTYGALINNFKNIFLDSYDKLLNEFQLEEINKKLASEKIDISLPSTKSSFGTLSVLEVTEREIESLFISMGYDVVEGPEVEYDKYNFEMLNLPKGHPARDAQDTFYIDGEEVLLRSQTSPIQIRTMLSNKEKTPIRIICPGKTYRRDDDDATHSHQFKQIEGLLVDEIEKQISLADLKGTLNLMAKKLFGEKTTVRFRPSFYPFTEPSVEYDISCFKCNGKGCNICKNTGWITIGGAGMVHPNVLDGCGYDHTKYQGFAFGFGIERMAMLKYGINDIRVFYTNDLRERQIFDRKED